MCTAHGISLPEVAGSASNTHGLAKQRVMSGKERKAAQEAHLSCEVVPSARGAGSRVYRRPQWSLAELGQAAKDVPAVPWLAAQYSFAQDVSAYEALWNVLALRAHEISRREAWSPRVRDTAGKPQFYHGTLAALVLDAEMHRPIFLAGGSALFAIYLNVPTDTWEQVLFGRYISLQVVYERWLGTALRKIQRALSQPQEVSPGFDNGKPLSVGSAPTTCGPSGPTAKAVPGDVSGPHARLEEIPPLQVVEIPEDRIAVAPALTVNGYRVLGVGGIKPLVPNP